MMISGGYNNNSVSFGLNNPQAALYRASQLKEAYAKKGISYLMPNEVWSNSKISETLTKINKYLKFLDEKNLLSKDTIQNAVNMVLPLHAQNKILIKDLANLQNDLVKEKGYTVEQAKKWANVGGLNFNPINNKETNEIYLKLADINGTERQRKYLRSTLIHELQHALKGRFQNITTSNVYNISNVPMNERFKTSVFHDFESLFYPCINKGIPSNLSNEEFYGRLGVKNKKELYKKFVDKYREAVEIASPNDVRSDGKISSKYINKDCFDYMRKKANDEKYSYSIQTKFRDKSDITARDYAGRLYSEMARFFASMSKALTKGEQV